ncbi:MAG: FAD:protein FMN transferase [Thermoleophilia bacterium]
MTRALRVEPFRAMGSDCAIAVVADEAELADVARATAAARAEIAACERVLSCFLPDSDLSRVNAAAGTWIDVDPRLAELTALALEARRLTDGRFDPTVLPALVAEGYDRSFEDLTPRAPAPLHDWRPNGHVDVDRKGRRVRVAAGTGIDLGGIAKGWTADRALAALRDAWPGVPGAFVDLGGDLRLWGRSPEDGPWGVAVADPRGGAEPAASITIAQGAVATSGRDRRRFGPDRSLHHLIDPTTGHAAVAGPLTATVVAPTGWEAEMHATVLATVDEATAERHLRANPSIGAIVIPQRGPAVALGRLAPSPTPPVRRGALAGGDTLRP